MSLGRRAVDLNGQSEPLRQALLRERLADYLVQVGQIEGGLSELRSAARLIESQPADAERARIGAAMARTLMLASNLTEAVPLAEQAIALANRSSAPAAEASALITLGVAQAGLGRVDDGLGNLRRGLEVAEEAGASGEVARAYLNLNYALWSTGHVHEALEIAQEGIRHAQSQGAEWTWGVTLMAAVGELLYDLGRWTEAETMFHATAERQASGTAEIDFRRSLAQLRIGQGRLDEARVEIQQMDRLTESLDLAEHSTWQGFLHASLAAWSGDWRAARSAADAAMAQMPPDDLPFEVPRLAALAIRADAELALLADAHRNPGRAAEARERAARTVEIVEQLASTPSAAGNVRLAAQVALVMAESSRASALSDAAAWADATRLFDAIPMPFEAAYCRLRHAEVLLAERKRMVASELLHKAHKAAAGLGAAVLVHEISGLAARARIDLATQPAPEREVAADVANPFGLTVRELEVLRLLSQGRTNRQVAAELFITVKTASLHVSNILSKLGVANRVEAAGVAHRLGLDTAVQLPS